jgi:hypothetical protein
MATVTRKLLVIALGPVLFYITRKLVTPPAPRSEYFAQPTNLVPKDSLRGGELTPVNRAILKRIIKEIRYALHKNLPLLVGFTGVLAGMLSSDFHDESIALLIQLSKIKLNLERLTRNEKDLINFLDDLDLKNASDRIRERAINDHLNMEDKWILLKLKLKSICKKEVWMDNKNIILGLISLFLMVYISLPSGYGSFLGLLLKLFRDGKISKAAFDELREMALSLDAQQASNQVVNFTTTIFSNKTVQEQVIRELVEQAQ